MSKPKGGVKESVPDFFSDMEPVIPKAKNLLEQGSYLMKEVGSQKLFESLMCMFQIC